MGRGDYGFRSIVQTEAGRIRQREIASKAGRAAHEKGTGHEWTSEEARNAGRKGGQASRGGRGRVVPPADASEVDTGLVEELAEDIGLDLRE